MKLYTFPGAPNPLRVDLALAEKNLQLTKETIDLTSGQQLLDQYRSKNPNCDVPMLDLDDGACISQVPAICLYLEGLYPDISLYGGSLEDRAKTIMWEHLCFQNGLQAVGDILRNTSKDMANRALVGPHDYTQIPALAERGRKRTRNFFEDLNTRLSSNDYVAGDFFSMADITAWVTCNFATWVKEGFSTEHPALRLWHDKLAKRPAFAETLAALQPNR